MAGWSTRFATQKIDKFFDEANDIATNRAQVLYTQAVEDVAEWWGDRIAASGRGGDHNAEMAGIEGRVTQPRKGGFFFRVGWLNHPPMAADGRTSWFVYQDVGYDPFGMAKKGYGASRVPGLLLQLDARSRLQESIRDANAQIGREIHNAARRAR